MDKALPIGILKFVEIFLSFSRDKLEPLGVDTELDKCKLVQSKKPSEKKAVKKAYEEAILHR